MSYFRQTAGAQLATFLQAEAVLSFNINLFLSFLHYLSSFLIIIYRVSGDVKASIWVNTEK